MSTRTGRHHSSLSLDVGDIRVRFEGGSREARLTLAQWFSMSRAVVETNSPRSRSSSRRRH